MSTEGSNAAKRRREAILKFFDKFGELVTLNLLFVLGCIPIFTIGTSITAVYYVTNQMVREKYGVVRKDWWKSYKMNLKQTVPIWTVMMILVYLMYIGVQYARITTGAVHTVLVAAIIAVMLLLLFVTPLLFPLIARYNNTTGRMILNSIILSIKNLGTWLKVFIMWVAPIGVYLVNIKIFAYTWVLWIVLLVALLAYATSLVLKPLFDEMEEKMGVSETESDREDEESNE